MAYDFSLKKNSIGFYEVYPKPSLSELAEYYAEKYYQESGGSYAHRYSKDELRYFDVSGEIAFRTIKKYRMLMTNTLLDLGCGEGFFSKVFARHGWKATLVDFSAAGLTQHNPSLLNNFTQADVITFIETKSKELNAFELINLDNVLEHVIDPIKLLSILASCMHPDAILRIEVPNDFSSFQDLLVQSNYTEKTWINPPEHLSYFNTGSLKALLETQGFELISLQADFPIEQFLVNEHSNYWKNRHLGREAHMTRVIITNYLAAQGLDSLIAYQEAAAALDFGRLLTGYVKVAR